MGTSSRNSSTRSTSAKTTLAMLLMTVAMESLAAFPNHWNLYGKCSEPMLCTISTGDRKKQEPAIVGYTWAFMNPLFHKMGSNLVLYSGSPAKQLFITCTTSDVAANPPDGGPHSFIEVAEKDIPAFHQACVKAAQFEKSFVEDEEFRFEHSDNFKAPAVICGIDMTRIEIEFPKVKLWTCYDTYNGLYKCVNESQPIALISFLLGQEWAYGLLAMATPRKHRRLPQDWWRHWESDKEVRLDIFDFSSQKGDSFAKLAEETDPAYLDFFWKYFMEPQSSEEVVQRESDEAAQVNKQSPVHSRSDSSPAPQSATVTDKAKCPSCSAPVLPSAKFCPECGVKMARPFFCQKCGKESSPGAKFCTECGTRLSEQ